MNKVVFLDVLECSMISYSFIGTRLFLLFELGGYSLADKDISQSIASECPTKGGGTSNTGRNAGLLCAAVPFCCCGCFCRVRDMRGQHKSMSLVSFSRAGNFFAVCVE